MKKVLLISIGIVLLLGLWSASGFSWIGDEWLMEIDQRIREIERRFLDLDESEILNRLEWADWGIDILEKDMEGMGKEIEKERKKWQELRREEMTSEEAWREWKEAGRELDKLEGKKRRLNSVLHKIKMLRNRLKGRLVQVRRSERRFEFRPFRPFRLGVVAGMLDSTPVAEIQIGTPVVDVFYGSRREEYPKIVYFGIKKGLEIYQSETFSLGPLIGFQYISVEDYWRWVIKEGIELFLGGRAEIKWINVKGEKTALSLEFRYAFGKEPNLWMGVGLLFEIPTH